ncbi:MAG TPA: hypothetical protein EYP18_00135 [Desulfobacterales bacterium]|nr:hypothetical protein [Desulfobacterales bacterium]
MKKNARIIIFSLLLALIPIHAFAAAPTESITSEDTAIVTLTEGKVKRYNQDTQTVLLQLKSGEKISIEIDWNTALVGYSSPNDIEKGQKVKIWHSNTDDKTKAVKIEKKLMLGC